MKEKDLEALAGVVANAMKEVVAGPQVGGRIQELENRIAALEARPHIKYLGTYEAGKSYSRGDGATHHGSLRICKSDYAGEPGKDHDGWTIAVKRGRDGRDAR